MTVRSHQGVRKKHPLPVLNNGCQVFQVHLVHNAGGGGHHAELVEGLARPFEELVPFAVALEFHAEVDVGRLRAVEGIHLNGVVDDQVAGHLRIHFGGGTGIAGHVRKRVAHRRQVDHRRHAGEILENNAGGFEGDFGLSRVVRVVLGQRPDMVGGHSVPVKGAQAGLQQNADGVGEPVDVANGGVPQCGDRKDRSLADRGLESFPGLERIVVHNGLPGYVAQQTVE